MLAQQKRAVVWAAAALVGIWAAAMTGYWISKNATMTAERVGSFVASVDLSQLKGPARAKALQDLEQMINRLSLEDRQRMRADRLAEGWFGAMTEEEKSAFIEATMPTGFKQMLDAFEQLPEDKRRKTIEDAVRGWRQTNSRLQAGPDGIPSGTNRSLTISPEIQAQVRTLGLKSFYSQSSAQTKAELAPVLEELQRAMESGRAFRGR